MNYCDFSTLGVIPETGRIVLQCTRNGCGKTVRVKSDRCISICKVQEDGFVMPSPNIPGVERPTAESLPCSHRGGETKFKVDCGCGGNIQLIVYSCDVLDYCTIPSLNRRTIVNGKKVSCCLGCDRRE
jgi:hypothetical protein